MPANFGLLNSAAQVPMSVDPIKMNTPVQNQTVRLNMEGKQIDVAQAKQDFDEGSQDKAILKDALSQQNVDLATPDGIKNLLDITKGKISAKASAGLVDHAEKISQTHLRNQQLLTKMRGDQLDQYDAQMEQLVPQLDSLDKQYDKTKAEKGQTAAEAELREGTAKLALNNRDKLLPDGSPMFSPQIFQNLKDGPIDIIHGVVAGSKYIANQTKQAKDAAMAQRQAAEAEILKAGGKNWDEFQDKDGTIYRSSKLNGQILRQDPVTGALTPVPAMPAGIQKLGATTQGRKAEIWQDEEGHKWSVLDDRTALKDGVDIVPIGQMPGNVKKMGSKGAGEKSAALEPSTLEWLSDYATRTGKSFPVPAFGIGNTSARAEYLNSAAKLAKDRGYDGSEAGDLALQRDAAKLANANLQKQSSIIKVGEQDLVGVMGQMKKELEKLGGPDSPKVRGLWNKASTDWMGDPEFKGFNAAYANFLDVAAKTLSGQSGAGGTPVSYLEIAKKQLGENPNLSQVAEVEKMMTKLFKIREEAVAKTSRDLLDASKMPAKEGSAAEKRARDADPTGNGGKVPAADQKEKDSDAVAAIRKEYNTSVEKAKSAKTPEERARFLSDARAARKELKNSKVDVPDPGTPDATDTKEGGWKEIAPGVRVRVKPGG